MDAQNDIPLIGDQLHIHMTDHHSRRLAILYATETGNSYDVAKRIGREARRYGWHPVIQSLHVYDVLQLQTERTVIFVVATTGQGDVPVKMKSFWKFLFRKSLKTDVLEGMEVAVFGLGDSAYVKFNVVAKKLHNRLTSLGATAVVHRGLGDDQAAAGYEAALDPWLSGVWSQLNARHGLQRVEVDDGLELCPFEVEIGERMKLVDDSVEWFRDSILDAGRFHQLEGGAETDTPSIPGMDHPFFARVKRNDRITSSHHFQDTRHLVLDITDSGLEYNPGDVLAMHPLTPWSSIDAFLKRIGIDPTSTVTVKHASSNQSMSFIARSLVQGVLDVDGASPRRFFFEVLSHAASEAKEIDRLSFFASAAGREELSLYCKQSGRVGDFYYESEWKTFGDAGILDNDGLLTAFSRDQTEKIYVTHKIEEDGARVCRLLMNGAAVFVAGSANKMPSDVHEALVHVLIEHGPMTESEAQSFLRRLETHGRYQVESWS